MIVMNNNHKNGRVIYDFKDERLVRKEPWKKPDQLPVIGQISFVDTDGKIVDMDQRPVAIEEFKEKNGTLAIKIVDVLEGSKKFVIPRKNLFSLVVTQDNKKFRKHLKICNGRLRDLKKGANHA